MSNSSSENTARPERPAKPKATYNPRIYARKVRGAEPLPGGVESFVSKSWTKDDDTRHEGHIDTQTGEVRCTCGHFEYRLARLNPTWLAPETWCKHITARLARLEQTEAIPALAERKAADAAERDARWREALKNGEYEAYAAIIDFG